MSNNIPTMGSSNHRRQHGVKTVAVKAAGSAVTAYAGAVQTVPADRDIESAAWSSADCLLLGLSHGDVLLVKLKRSQDEDISSSSLQVHERMLRDRGSGLQALWSEFMGGAADSNCDTICLATQAASALAVNRSGELRQWNVGAEILVSQTSLFDLLDAVGAVDALAPIRVQGSTTNSSGHGQNGTIDRNIHLQGDCC